MWEPSILNYSSEIDPEQDAKRREAVLKYYGNNVVKATEFPDIVIECRLIQMHLDWLKDEVATDDCEKLEGENSGVYIFFEGMWHHLFADFMTASEERRATGISLHFMKDREYHVYEFYI